ncbi:MAG TPA: OmpH family outer membrane protein [Saprospiraceae bacterium]|nr:OmpH family outer membrane protein [Saprospiraceae bacterium]HHH52686.1 OmpH family outer membrane protein [Bacteroidota bacterium]
MKIKYLFIVVTSIFMMSNINAQKFGYINSTELLLLHPDVKSADTKLQEFQNQLLSKGQKMANDFQKHYEDYMKEANAGTLSKIQMQERENNLTQEQNKIRQYQVDMQQQLEQKRQELYQPILDKIQKAINEVGKENNYTFIFDAGTGGILHADESDNLLNLVKTKLGI